VFVRVERYIIDVCGARKRIIGRLPGNVGDIEMITAIAEQEVQTARVVKLIGEVAETFFLLRAVMQGLMRSCRVLNALVIAQVGAGQEIT